MPNVFSGLNRIAFGWLGHVVCRLALPSMVFGQRSAYETLEMFLNFHSNRYSNSIFDGRWNPTGIVRRLSLDGKQRGEF